MPYKPQKVEMNFNQINQLIKFSSQQEQNQQNQHKIKKQQRVKKISKEQILDPALKFLQTELKSLTQTLRILQCPICYQPYTYEQNSPRLPIIICSNEKYNITHLICKYCYVQQYNFIKQNKKVEDQRIALNFARQMRQQLNNYNQIREQIVNSQRIMNLSNINENNQHIQIQSIIQQIQSSQSNRQQINIQVLQQNLSNLAERYTRQRQNTQNIIRLLHEVTANSDSSDYSNSSQISSRVSSQYDSSQQQTEFKGKCPLCRKKIYFEQDNLKYHQKLIDWLKLSKQLNIQLPKQSIQQIPSKYKYFLQQYSRRDYLIKEQQRILKQNQEEFKQKIQRQKNQISFLDCKVEHLCQQMQMYGHQAPILKKHYYFLQLMIDRTIKLEDFRQIYKNVFQDQIEIAKVAICEKRQFLPFYYLIDQIAPLISQIKYFTSRQQQLLQQDIIPHIKECKLCRCIYHNNINTILKDNQIIFGYNQEINTYFSLSNKIKSSRNCSTYLKLLNTKKQLIQKIDLQRIQKIKQLHSKLNKHTHVILKFIEIMKIWIEQRQYKQDDIIEKYYNVQNQEDSIFQCYEQNDRQIQNNDGSQYILEQND